MILSILLAFDFLIEKGDRIIEWENRGYGVEILSKPVNLFVDFVDGIIGETTQHIPEIVKWISDFVENE